MDKRLEEIKHYTKIWKNYDFDGDVIEEVFMLPKKDFYWIVERLQELEEEYKVRQVEYLEEHIDRLEQQNKRYREALEFYAKKDNHIFWEDIREGEPFVQLPISEIDKGKTARKALEESE